MAIKSSAELKLTLLILARAARTGDPCPPVTYAEFRSATGLSPASIAQGLREMQARGYIHRHITKRKQPDRYQVIWEKFGTPPDGHPPAPLPGTTRLPKAPPPAGPEFYFTNTGFLDLLPQAIDIANELGYGVEEMAQAVCLVFDKQRSAPPTRNRTAWFMTVFREKLHEAHAQIRAHEETKNRTG